MVPMRFLHTSDWHLGKTLCNASLLDDQAHLLEQTLLAIRDTRPHALVIAGDIYDRAVPPKEAVSLLDAFLVRVIREAKVPVLLIAGNHDSPERLGFGSRFLGDQGLFVAGTWSSRTPPSTCCPTGILPPCASPSRTKPSAPTRMSWRPSWPVRGSTSRGG